MARVRSLYFGGMLSRYMSRKQWVVGVPLGLSSGAVIPAIGALVGAGAGVGSDRGDSECVGDLSQPNQRIVTLASR